MPSRTATSLPYTEMEVATGNFDTSRSTIDRVVIHTMVGTAAAAAARFDNPASIVSAHYGVKLDGSLIHWLEEYNTAYHAGNYAMNQRSIGIEHEDNGDYNGTRTDALYETSANLVRDICNFYSIPIDRAHILKHSEVIATGCPDALDIDRIVRQASNNGSATTNVEVDSATFQKLVTNSTKYDAFNAAGYSTVADVTSKITALNAQIDDLQKQLANIPTTQPLPPVDNSALLTQIAQLTKKLSNIHTVTYSRWNLINWASQLHKIKFYFEKT